MSVMRGVSFSLTNQFLSVAVNIGSLAILGRLLSPTDFGLFGLVLAAEALFLPFLSMGLVPAYIKLEQETQEASDAFLTVNIILGIGIALALCLSAPLLVRLYEKKVLLQLTSIYALSIFFRSLASQPMAVLARQNRFDKLMYVQQFSLVSGVLAGVLAAWAGWGVWALIAKAIVQGMTRALAAFIAAWKKYRLVPLRTVAKYKKSLIFGAEIVISRIVTGLYGSVDKLVFGKFFNVDILGHYTRAQNLARIPDANIRTAFTKPVLVYLARIKAADNIRQAYSLMTNLILWTAGLPCVLFILIGDKILPWLMGAQWEIAGGYLQILGIWGIGKILQGIAVILNMNEMRMRGWIGVNLAGLGIIFVVPVSAGLMGAPPEKFILLFSVSYLLYWLGAIIYYVYKYTHSLAATVQLVRQIAIMAGGVIILFFCTDTLWERISGLGLQTFFSIMGFSVAAVLFLTGLQYVFNRTYLLAFFSFFKQRLSR